MKRQLLILLAAAALLAGACGATGDEKGSGEEEGPSTTAAAKAETSSASFGELKEVCGPGNARVKDGEGGGSTTDLNIGVANDRSSTVRPGVNQELWDASRAFASWCNEQGGIDGLKINLIDMDGKLFEVESAMAKACNGAFAMVGGAFIQDSLEFSGKEGTDFHKCRLIDVPAFAVTVQKGLSNGQVQPVPNPPNKRSTQWVDSLKQVYPAKMKSNVVVYGDLPTLKVVKLQHDAAVAKVGGIQALDAISYPVTGLADWTPVAQRVKESGATSVYFIGEPVNGANLLKALRDQQWDGLAFSGPNLYDPLIFSAGDNAAEGMALASNFHPLEEADRWPAVKKYLATMDKYAPDGKKAALGMQSMSAWLLFATAVSACAREGGGVVERSCVLSQAASQKDWTGGGLHSPTSPGVTEPAHCGMLMVATQGRFERTFPEEDSADGGFSCPADPVATVTEDLGAAGAVDPSRPPL